MPSQQDDFQAAREAYDDAREAMRDNHTRMREDLRFSNPADPQQWHKDTLGEREGRVTLTLDQTNQFIGQVVNDGRQNTPAITTVPVDSKGDPLVAQQANGIIKHLEYRSRAGIAYDTALEYGARNGLGWLIMRPVVVDKEHNYQEPRIFGVHDPLSCVLDADSVEYDGSDAMRGWAEAMMSKRAFERRWPKAKATSFETAAEGWVDQRGIRVAEHWCVTEDKKQTNTIKLANGGPVVTEDEYWQLAKQIGYKPDIEGTELVDTVDRNVNWYHMNGVEMLDKTSFPCKWIGLVPVYGHIVWVDGERFICGLTRRLMDGQRLHNYATSSVAETLLEQPKAPFTAPARAIEGHEDHWSKLNTGNPSYLPYNDIDDEGEPVSAPTRQSPPQFSTGFANISQMGVQEMQAAVGMNRSVLGQQSNAVSGRAKIADKVQGDTATFHYQDNRNRSIEHLGRMLLDATGRLIDTPRQMRILGLDDKPSQVLVDPTMQQAVKRDPAGRVVAINLSLGEYDMRVKAGPSHTTLREELQERLTALGQSSPQLAAALAPLLVKIADLPDADRVARICLSLLPPQVQQAYGDDEQDGANIPPQIKAQMMSMQQQLQQAQQMLQQLAAKLQEAQSANVEAQAAADIKMRELELKSRELDIKEQEAQADLVRANAEADSTAVQAHGEAVAAVTNATDTAQQVQALLVTVQQVLGAHQELTSQVQQTQENVGALAEAATGTQDQLEQLAALVAAPRVARIEYDADGRPVAAVANINDEVTE